MHFLNTNAGIYRITDASGVAANIATFVEDLRSLVQQLLVYIIEASKMAFLPSLLSRSKLRECVYVFRSVSV
jgi:hypothetical protein